MARTSARKRWVELRVHGSRLESPDAAGGSGVPASRAAYPPHCDVVDARTGRRECGSGWRLLDPAPDVRGLQRRAVPGIRGHSDYRVGPDWDDALARVGAPVRPPPLPAVDAAAPPDPRVPGRPDRRSPAGADGGW